MHRLLIRLFGRLPEPPELFLCERFPANLHAEMLQKLLRAKLRKMLDRQTVGSRIGLRADPGQQEQIGVPFPEIFKRLQAGGCVGQFDLEIILPVRVKPARKLQ